jgi:signal transduction histidine kinase
MKQYSSTLLWLGRFGAVARWRERLVAALARLGGAEGRTDDTRTGRHLDRFIADSRLPAAALIAAALAAAATAVDLGASLAFGVFWALVVGAPAGAALYARRYCVLWRQRLIALKDAVAERWAQVAAAGIGLAWSIGAFIFGLASPEIALALLPPSVAVAAVGFFALAAMPVPARLFLAPIVVLHGLALLAQGTIATVAAALALAAIGAGMLHVAALLAPGTAAELKARDRAGNLQAAIERIRLGIIVIDSDRRILVANSATAAMLRLDVALLAPGSDFDRVAPYLPGLRLDDKSFEPGFEPRRQSEFRTPQGRLIELREVPRADGACVIVLEDITTRRRREIQQQRDVMALDSVLRGSAFEETVTALATSAWGEVPGLCFGVLLHAVATQRLQLVVSVGLPEDLKRTYLDLELRAAPALLRDAIERHIEGSVPDLAADANLSIVERAELKRSGFAACWAHPILGKSNEALGVIVAFRPQVGGPSPDEIDLARALSRSIANAYARHATLHQRLEREEIELAQGAKQRFLANMGHELRTPLNAINGFADAMRSHIFGPLGHKNYADYARDIYASGTQLLDSINSVLEYAQIESNAYELKDEPLDLPRLVNDCIAAAGKDAGATRIELEINSIALPALRADRHAVGTAIRHLLANAVKFAPKGSTVSVATGISEGREIWLQVKDRGIGIAPELMGRVLRPFSMLAHPLARDDGKGGIGLGLPLAKAYIELHGGRLVLDSALGQGTQATIVFPAERALIGAAPFAAPPGVAARV